MTTRAFLYPAKQQILGFTFQTLPAGWVLALPRVFWIPPEGQASGSGARTSRKCSADGYPAAAPAAPPASHSQVTGGPEGNQ